MSETSRPGRDPLVNIARSLGRIEGRLEQWAIEHAEDRKVLENHESRIKALETTRAEMRGGWRLATIVGALASGATGVVAAAIGMFR